MKAATITEVRIHCDTCGHEFDGTPPEWHHQDCPACGAAEIITDGDMDAFAALSELVDAVNDATGEISENQVVASVDVCFDTARLRHNAEIVRLDAAGGQSERMEG